MVVAVVEAGDDASAAAAEVGAIARAAVAGVVLTNIIVAPVGVRAVAGEAAAAEAARVEVGAAAPADRVEHRLLRRRPLLGELKAAAPRWRYRFRLTPRSL